jgi:hypothetical protein
MQTATPDVKHVFEGILRRHTDGDLQHADCGNGLTFLQSTANEIFRDPTTAGRTMAEFDFAEPVGAALRYATGMNRQRLKLLGSRGATSTETSPAFAGSFHTGSKG